MPPGLLQIGRIPRSSNSCMADIVIMIALRSQMFAGPPDPRGSGRGPVIDRDIGRGSPPRTPAIDGACAPAISRHSASLMSGCSAGSSRNQTKKARAQATPSKAKIANDHRQPTQSISHCEAGRGRPAEQHRRRDEPWAAPATIRETTPARPSPSSARPPPPRPQTGIEHHKRPESPAAPVIAVKNDHQMTIRVRIRREP